MNRLHHYFGSACSPREDGRFELFADGASRFATHDEISRARKRMLQDYVYCIAAQKLNAQSADYGDPEKATWGLLQNDVVIYLQTGVIGLTLRRAVDNTLGVHTVDTLVAKLTALAQYQDAVLQARAQHIKNILALPDDAIEYDVNTGWPNNG